MFTQWDTEADAVMGQGSPRWLMLAPTLVFIPVVWNFRGKSGTPGVCCRAADPAREPLAGLGWESGREDAVGGEPWVRDPRKSRGVSYPREAWTACKTCLRAWEMAQVVEYIMLLQRMGNLVPMSEGPQWLQLQGLWRPLLVPKSTALICTHFCLNIRFIITNKIKSLKNLPERGHMDNNQEPVLLGLPKF